MDDQSYNDLRAELLYDSVIENLLSLVLSQNRLEYSEVEEKKWKKIPEQLLLLKGLRPTLFTDNVTPELNPYKFSKEKLNVENKNEISKDWGFLAPLDISGQKFLKEKANCSNKFRTLDASPLVFGAKDESFKIYTDFFDMITFKPFTEETARYWVQSQRKKWEAPKYEGQYKIKRQYYCKKISVPNTVTVFNSYYVNCANQELVKVKRLVKTISRDRYFYQSYPYYKALDGSQIPVNDFHKIHLYYLKLKSIVIEYRTLPSTNTSYEHVNDYSFITMI